MGSHGYREMESARYKVSRDTRAIESSRAHVRHARRSRIRRVCAAGIVLSASLGCAARTPAVVSSSHRDPNVGAVEFHRLLVTFVSTDSAVRHAAEDRMARRIGSSYAAYIAVPQLSTNQTQAREQLRARLFDGAVVMRVVDVENPQAYVPGDNWYAAYPTFSGYWESSWTMARNPSYSVKDRVVTIETAVYSIADDKLVWAGRTRAEKPVSLATLVNGAIDAVARDLTKQRLLP